MNEFLPPTKRHLIAFTILAFGGTVWSFYEPAINQFLERATSILILSAGWAVIIVEGYTMFVEGWLEQRKEEGRKEGRQKAKDLLLKKFQENLSSTGEDQLHLTQEDILRLFEDNESEP